MMSDPSEWPPPDDWIERDIVYGDSVSLANRIARYRFVATRFPRGEALFLGGIPQMFAFEEMQRSYVAANYMAVVLCAQAFVEHSLAVTYAFNDDEQTARAGFAKLIDRALADGDLDPETADRLHALRMMRNPYVHPGSGTKGYDNRLIPGKHPLLILQEDAESALETVAHFIRRAKAEDESSSTA